MVNTIKRPCGFKNLKQFLELISEDGRLNVYAGEREVRPPPAPTASGTGLGFAASESRKAVGWSVNTPRLINTSRSRICNVNG